MIHHHTRTTRRRLLTAAGVSMATNALQKIDPVIAVSHGESTPLVMSVDALIAAATVAEQPITILDAASLRTYRANHIPSAVHTFWQDTIDRNYPVFGAVITQGFDQQQRLEYISRIGAEPDELIAVYDDDGGFRSARIVWFLRFLGFTGATLLDGGLTAWQQTGGSAESGVNQASSTRPPTVEPQEGYYVVTEALLDRFERGDSQIVDIRTPAEREDTLSGQLPLGEIPGSLRWPWDSLIDHEAGALAALDQLADSATQAGVTDANDIVVYGRFGVETALSWLVLKHLGFPTVLTYDRGWVEWASTPGMPIASINR